MIIYRIRNFRNFDSFPDCQIMKMLIFEIEQLREFDYFINLSNMEI